MMLCGAELGKDKAIREFGIKSKWRILPKGFGEYRGKKILEIEQICVGTNSMNYQGYLNCRNYSFIVKLLGHPVLKPIKKLTDKLGISWFDFSRAVSDLILNEKYQGKFKDLFKDFCKDSHEELFDTQKEAIDFYSIDENYKALVNGDIGENLMSKYTGRALLILDDIISVMFSVIRKQHGEKLDKELHIVLDSSEKWLKNLYLIDIIYSDEWTEKSKKNKLKIDFDFPSWMLDTKKPFKNFIKNSTYEFDVDIKKIKYIKNEIDTVTLSKRDKQRAFARYIERRSSESNFFKKEYHKI